MSQRAPCERSGFPVRFGKMARKTSVAARAAGPSAGSADAVQAGPDYDAADVLVVRAPEQLTALADDLRSRIVILLREHARSTTELAARLGLPKGTVAHHIKVLESAGLIRVVRTRRVRALTEKYYGRTARLFLYESNDAADAGHVRNIVAASLRVAADEILPLDPETDDVGCSGAIRVRLTKDDALRFNRRLDRLITEFRKAEDPSGDAYGLAIALYKRNPDA
jgi:DNA-binding transcriptional ArsR family regulator